jgi:hypothetical protein
MPSTPPYTLTEGMRLNKDGEIIIPGNVGIGTTSPLSKFDLRGTAYVTGYAVGFDTSPQGNYAYRLTNDGANSFINVLGGNLGIGTTSPTADLSVGSTTTSSGDVHLRTTKTAFSITPSNTNAGGILLDLGWVNGGQGPMKFGIGSAERMRIDSLGQAWFKSSTDFKIGLNDSAGVNQWWLNSYTSGDFAIHENGVGDKFNIKAGGNVGIGVTNPANKLEVDGHIKVLGRLKLGPSSSIQLDDTPTASTASGSGTIVNWSVSDATTAGTLYTVKTNGLWTPVDADNESTSIGMLAIALDSNAMNGMLLQGFFYKASHGFTIGLPLYISNTAGAFSTTRPTGTNDYVRIIGYATSANYIYFDPDKTWVKVA